MEYSFETLGGVPQGFVVSEEKFETYKNCKLVLVDAHLSRKTRYHFTLKLFDIIPTVEFSNRNQLVSFTKYDFPA